VTWLGVLAVQHALSLVAGDSIEAPQKLLKLPVRGNGDPQHLGTDPFVEALHHAIRLRLGVVMLSPELGAVSGKGLGKTTAVVGQHVSAMKW
jgi:hypothetical protein